MCDLDDEEGGSVLLSPGRNNWWWRENAGKIDYFFLYPIRTRHTRIPIIPVIAPGNPAFVVVGTATVVSSTVTVRVFVGVAFI